MEWFALSASTTARFGLFGSFEHHEGDCIFSTVEGKKLAPGLAPEGFSRAAAFSVWGLLLGA